MNGFQSEEVSRLKEEIEELKKQHELLQGELSDKNVLIENMVGFSIMYCKKRSVIFFSLIFISDVAKFAPAIYL